MGNYQQGCVYGDITGELCVSLCNDFLFIIPFYSLTNWKVIFIICYISIFNDKYLDGYRIQRNLLNILL